MKDGIFTGIEQKSVKGYRGIQLPGSGREIEVEFTTIRWRDTIEAFKQFAGDDYETAYVHAKAREVITRLMPRPFMLN